MAELRPRPTTRPSAPQKEFIITLVKGEDRWRFQWESGLERQLINALAEMASDPNHPLDRFDAAVVCHQINHQITFGGPALPDSSIGIC